MDHEYKYGSVRKNVFKNRNVFYVFINQILKEINKEVVNIYSDRTNQTNKLSYICRDEI